MKAIFMRSWFLFLLGLIAGMHVKAQQAHFIYIQTENKQPFYVKMDKRVLSSSTSGYMIIAKLVNETYNLVIGFPNESPELNVTLQVKGNNTGYLLKNYGAGGWGMTNLQTRQLLAMQVVPVPFKEPEVKIDGDHFAKVLAQVVNDSSVGMITVVPPTGNGVKTITARPVQSPPVNTTINDPKVIDIANAEKKQNNPQTPAPSKSSCKKNASEDDFLKLLRQMTASDSEKSMARAARKQFVSMCFTTAQVKSLGSLFASEEAKYKFYVAAFPYVSDAGNFKELEVQLTDDYYKTRLKAMLSH